jgi:hypothetical protein
MTRPAGERDVPSVMFSSILGGAEFMTVERIVNTEAPGTAHFYFGSAW